ncbi:unnamed protein product [Schistosoma mattheei]|uniref:Uncharacterized protein n=1 Tax=Schistosoma mattheei TaxID=31246 RepID=A0A183NZ46_9TREM|nr:unnamed protein product [Schistosoma mattheei]
MDELTDAEHLRIEQNRKRALELRLSQVVANDRHDVYASVPQSKLNTKYLSDGGFIFEEETSNHNYPYTEKDEEFSDPELNATVKPKKRKPKCIKQSNAESNLLITESNVPIPPDQEKPTCDLCHKLFEESFLRKTFEVDVCDKCRDPKNIHALITKSSAKERYLLNDVDLDIREPKLNYLLKRNPHNSSWGDMRLYLEAQIAERALEIWGSEDALEKEREKRLKRNEESKLKSYSKKVKVLSESRCTINSYHKSLYLSSACDWFLLRTLGVYYKTFALFISELKLQTRSSLYTRVHKSHEHVFGPEKYDSKSDIYYKCCIECDYKSTYEKL